MWTQECVCKCTTNHHQIKSLKHCGNQISSNKFSSLCEHKRQTTEIEMRYIKHEKFVPGQNKQVIYALPTNLFSMTNPIHINKIQQMKLNLHQIES